MPHPTLRMLVYAVPLFLLVAARDAGADDWPQFRGANADGVAAVATPLPTDWDGEQKNVAWKSDLPGRGPSSPIVVEGRVIVTCSGGARQERLYVLALDASTGKELWRREFWATGSTLTHPTSANAAPTPASDGEHVVAFFSSNDLICLDLEGNLKWFRGLGYDYPRARNDIGMASSPVIVGDTVVVQVECYGESFAAGIDVSTGQNRWKIPRDKSSNWSSPTVYQAEDETSRVLLQSGRGISAHDPSTGEEQWHFDIECSTIPSPTAVGDCIIVPANGLTALTVVKEQPELSWESSKLGGGAGSPAIHEGKIYSVGRSGVLSCVGLRDGVLLWKVRLGIGRQWASPVIAGRYMYLFDSDGKAAVVELGEEATVVATIDMGEPILASPALADNARCSYAAIDICGRSPVSDTRAAILVLCLAAVCPHAQAGGDSPESPFVVVLGIAQDAGYPHAGCHRDCSSLIRSCLTAECPKLTCQNLNGIAVKRLGKPKGEILSDWRAGMQVSAADPAGCNDCAGTDVFRSAACEGSIGKFTSVQAQVF